MGSSGSKSLLEDVEDIFTKVSCRSMATNTYLIFLLYLTLMYLFTSFTKTKYVYVIWQDEIRRLTKRFDKLDTDGSGGISMEELMKLPELKGNPLAKRVYTVMGKYVNNTLTQKEWM